MPDEHADVIVLGSGTGGYAAALRSAQLGKRVTLVEKDSRLGGTCLIRGCIPTKALLRSAEVLDEINRSDTWGITASGTPDWDGILAFQHRMVDKLVKGLTGLIKARGIEVVTSKGRLVRADSGGLAVQAGDQTLSADDVVVATGSFARELAGTALSERVITSDQALSLPYLPSSVIVIGAGAVGLEFASFYRSMGAEVTVIEGAPRLAPLEDEDISVHLARAFKKRGIATATGAVVDDVVDTGTRVEVAYTSSQGKEQSAAGEVCLVAVGRGPVTESLGLEECGIELDRAYVKVDGTMRTTVPHVWAVGDVANTPLQFAHVAFAEGIGVAERIAGREVPEIDYTGVPRVTFSTPEVSSVGLTEAQARERGLDVAVEKFNFQGLGKANIVGEAGITKVVAEPDGGQILGIHMVGPHVTELVSEAMLITNWEASAADVASLIHPHPTLSEAIGESALALAGKPLNTA